MAKKPESRPKEQEAVPVAQENTGATPGSAAEGQEAVQGKQEPAAEAREATPEKREAGQAAGSVKVSLEEILNDDTGPAEENPPQEDDGRQDTDPPQEKILFYVKTVNDKTAIRSAPEYPMSGAENVINVITDRGPYGIVEVINGFGRIAGAGWIMLDPGVVIRQ